MSLYYLPATELEAQFNINLKNIIGINEVSHLAVAVSGGADSVALLHLVVPFASKNNIKVTVFSVDHNLRPEAKTEIAYVKSLADKFKFNFVPLSWQAGETISAIQARSREGRYELMRQASKELGIQLLLTAHHFDDMLETYLIKKSKKASSLALSPSITFFRDNLRIARPLFNIEKKTLINYLQTNSIKWFEDSSNISDKYERNRVRKYLEKIDREEKAQILAEYDFITSKTNTLAEQLIKALAETVSIYDFGFAKINVGKFNLLDKEIKIHILNYLLTIISGKTTMPRYRNLGKVLCAIDQNTFRSCTLNHCHLIHKNGEIIIFKEKIFIKQQDVMLNRQVMWDDRFQLVSKNPLPYIVSRLEMPDYIKLKKFLNLENLSKISNNSHKAVLFTIPVIKALEKVVAIPHISYYDNDFIEKDDLKVIFKPVFISRFTHFF